ncbi:MAG: helix-hairpin-helix domain-containing protein, partial [Bifidobacterium sp.]|nr:helix-hairpin-helix domain-containing protein [Bifidobacterium sp.]
RAIGGRYTSVDQLLDVPGIGAKTLARLRPYLVAQ